MSPIQSTGKVAAGFFEALKSEPIVLALCVMNFALIGFTYYQSSLFNSQRAENVKLFVQVQSEVQKLLSQCIIPPTPDRRSGSGDAPPQSEGPT
jgi:hypothetical protein